MKAILLIHGFVTDKEDLDAIIPTIAKMYDHVERVNLPGHNEGEKMKGFTCEATMQMAEEKTKELCEKYEIVDVIGFSMGGAIASHLTKSFPIRKIVLLSPANKYLNMKYPRANFQVQRDYHSVKRSLRKIKEDENPTDYENMLKIHEDIKKDRAISFELFFKIMLPNYTIKYLRVFRKIIKYCNDGLDHIENETLLIWGKLDQLVPISTIDFFKERCANLTTIVFDEISHLMLLSHNPKKIIDACRDFLCD